LHIARLTLFRPIGDVDDFFRNHPNCAKKFQKAHLVPGGPSLYDQVRSTAVTTEVIDLSTSVGSYWLTQTTSPALSVDGIPIGTPFAAFMGSADQRVPGLHQIDGFADVPGNRMFIGIPISNWGPDHLSSWPRSVSVLHEVLHFLWAHEGVDSHGTWVAILGATPSSAAIAAQGPNAVLTNWLNNDCPPKVKK
jgi:hypothetical protein